MNNIFPEDKNICVVLNSNTIQEAKSVIRDAYRIVKKDFIEFASKDVNDHILPIFNCLAKARQNMGCDKDSIISSTKYGPYFHDSHKVAFVSEQFLTMMSFLVNYRNDPLLILQVQRNDVEKMYAWYNLYSSHVEKFNEELNIKYRNILTKMNNIETKDTYKILSLKHEAYQHYMQVANHVRFQSNTFVVHDLPLDGINISEEKYITHYGLDYNVTNLVFSQDRYRSNYNQGKTLTPIPYIQYFMMNKLYNTMIYNENVVEFLYKKLLSENKPYLKYNYTHDGEHNLTNLQDYIVNNVSTSYEYQDHSVNCTISGNGYNVNYLMTYDTEENMKTIQDSFTMSHDKTNVIPVVNISRLHSSASDYYNKKSMKFKMYTTLEIDGIIKIKSVHKFDEGYVSNNANVGIHGPTVSYTPIRPHGLQKRMSICLSYDGKEFLSHDKFEYAADLCQDFYTKVQEQCIIKEEVTHEKISAA